MAPKAGKAPILTPQSEDFPQWYQDVLNKAELAESGLVRGTMVIRPYGYAIWEHMQSQMDQRIKAAGAVNAYFPLFIPESFLKREAEHVEGFSPELAVVTHAGGKQLDEPVVVRPTSEMVINHYFAKWIQSYRDLPMLVNQWANVVRWELRPRIFLRTTEFLWQEGHTAHATEAEARSYAQRILHEVYADFMERVLAIPVYVGAKTRRERFAGATFTYCLEGMMRDGKSLQLGTSHELGQNFSRVFDMTFLDENGARPLAWTTSWGVSTRLIGTLIMAHGDDAGLVVPPSIAPNQVVVLVVKDEGDAVEIARRITADLTGRGVRALLDDKVSSSFGRRATDWELKGVPVRVEIGPRDLAEGIVTVARRDDGTKVSFAVDEVAAALPGILEAVQQSIFDRALARREERTVEVADVAQALEAAQTGFARAPWSVIGEAGEAELNRSAVSVRCLLRSDGTVPESQDEPDLVAIIGRSY